MCGLLFLEQASSSMVSQDAFAQAVHAQAWRGPDSTNVEFLSGGLRMLGHNRLSILDDRVCANMPMRSRDGRYLIIYNGEIYNHLALREQFGLECQTGSDTETLIEGWALLGQKILPLFDGMYAFVIFDLKDNKWVCARDPFGIKPLYIHQRGGLTIIGSEPAQVAKLCRADPCEQAIEEWRLIRRPTPGHSFFKGVREVLPGTVLHSNGNAQTFLSLTPSTPPFDQADFEQMVVDSVQAHEMNDHETVALLSGGVDSAVIVAASSVQHCYSVGLDDNNEFEAATQTARLTNKTIHCTSLSTEQLRQNWRDLTKLRSEPLSVPNEGLIYAACKAMSPSQKVVLTGEGADELLFGYDRIFNWAEETANFTLEEFMQRYGYASPDHMTPRLREHLLRLCQGKKPIDFVEDFFLQIHLPCLLRRMDFASMAASKEARVPFVTKQLQSYMYRRPMAERSRKGVSKAPLRDLARRFGLNDASNRTKIGFSAKTDAQTSMQQEYTHFQSLVLESLGW